MEHVSTSSLLGLTSTLVLSGIYFGSARVALPVLNSVPLGQRTSGFVQLSDHIFSVSAPLTAFAGTCWGIAACMDPERQGAYALAGVVTYASIAAIKRDSANAAQNLHAKVADMNSPEETWAEEAELLLEQWTTLNMARSTWAAIGGLIGLSAMFDVLSISRQDMWPPGRILFGYVFFNQVYQFYSRRYDRQKLPSC
ncbi:hypothetical protein H2200_012262 [Cladophialophora chaetospira]|uniref:DUF1772-domain-containing protein n=1 Tax=Cladophialophora chaetospira TaxID=386627 RepID=A0AA39CCQ9_9EURO|nr:hypothetical protein H2200_012262 [Cladophialophora chaetospira]